jgi:hypothetical protein
MSGYKKFSDRWRIGADQDTPKTLAPLAALAGVHAESENANAYGTKNEESTSGAANAANAAKVTTPLHYQRTFAHLQLRPPPYVPEDRWQHAVEDGRRFLATWGEQAEALGWTSVDLFGLHTPPENPPPAYSRLSRYDCTGLCWLLQGRRVVALTESAAAIRNSTGNVTKYRRA